MPYFSLVSSLPFLLLTFLRDNQGFAVIGYTPTANPVKGRLLEW
jgi:hypothetical protein